MKKIILSISIAAVVAACLMAACNSHPKTTESKMSFIDTVGLAAFQQWKTQNELKDPQVYYMRGNEAAPSYAHARTASKKTAATHRTVSQSGGTMNSTSQYPAKSVKKGWSKAAKGTAIGAGSGAVLGAIINKKNRAVGGVVGGVLGGVLGYGVGRHMDKKDGR